MYDSAIHNYFSQKVDEELIPEEIPLGLKKISSLRYGEIHIKMLAYIFLKSKMIV